MRVVHTAVTGLAIATIAIGISFSASAVSAQQPPAKQPPAKSGEMDHSKMGGMDHDKMGQDHAMSPWKELDAYHMLMMATWHPAKDKSDMAPTRAKIGDMVAAAKTLAASTAPKGCDAPKVKAAAASLPKETQAVADLVSKKADDTTLKNALKELHEKFEVVEMSCTSPKSEKH